MGSQWHFDPESYLAMVRSEIDGYDRLQVALAEATRGVAARTILDLGSGTGVTARAVLAVHPGATLLGIDASEGMLVHARRLVPEATFAVGGLGEALPPGPFDLVVSAFAIHHLDGPHKSQLFGRVAAVLAPGGQLALLDVVVPAELVARAVPLEPGVDLPSSAGDQLTWLRAAGLQPQIVVAERDLAIITATKPVEREARAASARPALG